MASQHLESPHEQDTNSVVRTESLPAPTVESTPRPLPTDAEIQQAFQQMKASESRNRVRSGLCRLLQGRSAQTQDPDALLEMEFDQVLTVLREESRKRAKTQKLFVGLFLSIVIGMVLIAIVTHNTTMLGSMGSYVSLIAVGAAASQQQKAAAIAIARFDDVRAVGPLAEALEFKDKRVVPMAEQALIRLLPRLKASDAPLLSPEHRVYLNRALKGKKPELMLAILKAWEQVGDAGAIEEVEKIAAGRGRGGQIPRVVVAAQECLPFLRQSAERQQIGAQLLRPSDGNLTPSDVLLRPSMPHASTEPADQLLRPTNDAV